MDTIAGVCGVSGFKDGLLAQNLLDRPDLVAADHNGTIYIYDSGNKYFRVVDPVTKIMSTLLHGSCRLDYSMLQYNFGESALCSREDRSLLGLGPDEKCDYLTRI